MGGDLVVGTDTEWIDVTIVATTEKAILVTNGKDQAWIPKSQIIDHEDDWCEPGVATKVELPIWLLEKSGLT